MTANFAVIFKAELKDIVDTVDENVGANYIATAERMRSLAIHDYGCIDFVSVCEGNKEISISYWSDEKDILAWKNNPEHQMAQQKGAKEWYEHYSVEVVELKRSYSSGD